MSTWQVGGAPSPRNDDLDASLARQPGELNHPLGRPMRGHHGQLPEGHHAKKSTPGKKKSTPDRKVNERGTS